MQPPTLALTSEWNKTQINFVIGLFCFLLWQCPACGQSLSPLPSFSILFYNVENLFDTRNDSLTLDDEFLPEGLKHWTPAKLADKQNKLSKVILAANGFSIPDVVAMCEVENRFVMEKLLKETPLQRFNYRIIHKDSPDERGIDVALLYRSETVVPIRFDYLPLFDNQGKVKATREILHATLILGTDTLHVFVNHWPSRYQGQAETESERMNAATRLKQAVTEVQQGQKNAKIVLIGDFNDTPENESLIRGLGTIAAGLPETDSELINLSTAWAPKGTLKHQQSWQSFDQVIVSESLLNKVGLHCQSNAARIVELPFLLEDDPTWGGKRLFRTYRGYDYCGGFSDHLPVLLQLSQSPQD